MGWHIIYIMSFTYTDSLHSTRFAPFPAHSPGGNAGTVAHQQRMSDGAHTERGGGEAGRRGAGGGGSG